MVISPASSEYAIETAILDWLGGLGIGFFWKNTSGGFHDGKKWRKHQSPFAIRGTSDILGVVKGRFIAFEVKTDDGRATPEQLAFIKTIRANGGIADVVRSIDQVRSTLQHHGVI